MKSENSTDQTILRNELIAITALVVVLSSAMAVLYYFDVQTGVVGRLSSFLYSWIVN